MYRVFRQGRFIIAGALAAALLAALAAGSLVRPGGAARVQAEPDGAAPPTIVLDAGHGGVDPGAIGTNGAEEKEINLAITQTLRDILLANGYRVVMIREQDVSVNDPRYSKIAQIKTSDLKNRLKSIDAQPALAITIHQNFYTAADPHGAQMFYGRKNPESQRLAQALQSAFRARLQPDNERRVKRSTSDVYILHYAQNPIVLVECGFLSNPSECGALCDPEYQRKVAFTIFAGLSEYRAGGAAPEEAPGKQEGR